MRLTNRSGLLDGPSAIPVPDLSAGQSPNTGVIPYTVVDLYGKHPLFEEITVENVQIFPQTVTLQNLELIPFGELPQKWNKSEVFDTALQNL